MTIRLFLSLIFATIILSACAAQTPASSGPDFIGKIRRVNDTVQHNQNQVSGTNDLFQNDSLRMFNGGEGLLDFGSDLRLRMFNDTELGGVRTSNDPGTPLIGKLTLYTGGFSGQLFREGGSFEFDTPNGAQINVYGTTFIVAYDHKKQETLVVNFEGDVRVHSAGSQQIAVRPGEIYQVLADEQPFLWGEVPWTPGKYEELARNTQSALIPFESVLSFEPNFPDTGRTPTEPSVSAPSETSPLPTTLMIDPPTPIPSKTHTPIPPTPTETQVLCPPITKVKENAWCREGPSQIYTEIDSFTPGEYLDVEGRNKDESWWWVRKHTRGNCWISGKALDMVGDSNCLEYVNPPPTYTPTPTITITPSPTICPMMAMKYFEEINDPYSAPMTLSWKAVGGCGPYSGTLTAQYEGESPYLTQQISGHMGSFDDYPPSRCEGTFNIIYSITLSDGSGQVVYDSVTIEIIWIC